MAWLLELDSRGSYGPSMTVVLQLGDAHAQPSRVSSRERNTRPKGNLGCHPGRAPTGARAGTHVSLPCLFPAAGVPGSRVSPLVRLARDDSRRCGGAQLRISTWPGRRASGSGTSSIDHRSWSATSLSVTVMTPLG